MKPINNTERNKASWKYVSLLISAFLIFGFSVFLYAYTPVVEGKTNRVTVKSYNRSLDQIDDLLQKMDTISSSFYKLDKVDREYEEALDSKKIEIYTLRLDEFTDLVRKLDREIARDIQANDKIESVEEINSLRGKVEQLYDRLLSRYHLIMALRGKIINLQESSENWRKKHDELSVKFEEEIESQSKLKEEWEKAKDKEEQAIRLLKEKLSRYE